MRQYHCYFVQKDGAAAAWRAFESANDGEAEDYALGLLSGYPEAHKVEVWDETRLTLDYTRSAARSASDLRRLCYLALAAAQKENNPRIKQIIASCAVRLAQEAEALERRED